MARQPRSRLLHNATIKDVFEIMQGVMAPIVTDLQDRIKTLEAQLAEKPADV
jgi:hypothetical protein